MSEIEYKPQVAQEGVAEVERQPLPEKIQRYLDAYEKIFHWMDQLDYLEHWSSKDREVAEKELSQSHGCSNRDYDTQRAAIMARDGTLDERVRLQREIWVEEEELGLQPISLESTFRLGDEFREYPRRSDEPRMLYVEDRYREEITLYLDNDGYALPAIYIHRMDQEIADHLRPFYDWPDADRSWQPNESLVVTRITRPARFVFTGEDELGYWRWQLIQKGLFEAERVCDA